MAVSTARFTPVDIATLLYVAVATGAVLAFTGEDHAGWDSLMVAQALLVVLVLLASRAREAGPVGRFVGDWYPMLLLGGLYAEVGVVNVDLGYQHDELIQPLDQLIMLVAEVHAHHSDFRVAAAKEQHRVPVAHKAAQRAGLARGRCQQHQDGNQRMSREQPVPAPVVRAGKREHGGGGKRHVEERDEVDSREAAQQGPTPGREDRQGRLSADVVNRIAHSHPSEWYHVAVRRKPVSRSVRARQPVSWTNASARHVHAGARNSAALSADSNVARRVACAIEPMVHKSPRANGPGSGRTRTSRPMARPIERTRARLVVTAGWAA